MAPTASAKAAVQTFTDVVWTAVPGAVGYRVWRRRTDQTAWAAQPLARTSESRVHLPGLRGDDWFLGVSALAADGSESPIASAVPGGGFDVAGLKP
jgi:hypothetical protein